MKYTDLTPEDRLDVLNRVSSDLNIPSREIIEKDWWVTAVLRALFILPYAKHLSFKGGTSLSKCYGLIRRFSEDIDIAIDREYLGFSGQLSKTQISDKLRRAACSFVREQMQYDLAKALEDDGINRSLFDVSVDITPVSTTDPETINVSYRSALPSTLELSDYILPKVKIEVSGRSMNEPIGLVPLNSMIDQVYPHAPFTEKSFDVNAVLPERTFLEKMFLLHEEFSKSNELMRTERMSRHMYDLYQMLQTDIAWKAISNMGLYHQVIEHRRIFIGLKGFNYNTLSRETINIIPPKYIRGLWKADYEKMQRHMIYGQSPSFEDMLESLSEFNSKVKSF